MRFPLSLIFALLALFSWTASGREAIAQTPPDTPGTFLGYAPGSAFTPHHRVLDYVRHVEEHSPNVQVQSYGTTHEGRELVLAIVSTPQNLDRLDDIRRGNLALAGLNPDAPSAADALAVVWLSYNVHGNESVSTEAAMVTLHALADPTNARTQAWLENTIVIIDPCINPDGRDRYVNWYNRMLGTAPDIDPESVEHDEPWPGGRTNHYYFDLNRDWSWATQRETRARLAVYHDWMPQVHVINNPYYFAPAAEPFHTVITDWQRAFQTRIGRNHARYFDENGWLYFTKQVFDLFYPGYGDTYPTYNGAIGMTYEQGGSGSAGLAVRTATGDTLTLGDRIEHHVTTGLSTVEATAMHRAEVVEQFRAYFERGISEGSGRWGAYVMKATSGADRLRDLATHLDRLGLSYGTVSEPRRVDGLDYRAQTTAGFTAEPGDLIVPARQPRAVLARVLFEPEAGIPDSLTYDITAWALPYAYDLDAWATTEPLDIEPWAAPVSESRFVTDYPYAYVAAWDAPSDAAFLADVLEAGLIVRYAEKAFMVHGESYAPGSLILTRADNARHGDGFDRQVRSIAEARGVRLLGTETGFVDEGPDFGSSDVHYLERPEVLMLFGSPLSSGSVGEIWHWFDQVVGYPVRRVSADRFGSVDLDDYDVLVLPSGSLSGLFRDSELDRLRGWIRDGGRVVAVGGATGFFTGRDGFSLKDAPREETPDSTARAEAMERTYEDRERASTPDRNPGAVFRVRVDSSHPLGFGFGASSFVLRLSSSGPLPMTGSGDWNVGIVEKGARVSGHVGFEAEQKIEETLAFGVQGMGRGSVVYLVDNPLFRAFWHAGGLLMANAVFFGQ